MGAQEIAARLVLTREQRTGGTSGRRSYCMRRSGRRTHWPVQRMIVNRETAKRTVLCRTTSHVNQREGAELERADA